MTSKPSTHLFSLSSHAPFVALVALAELALISTTLAGCASGEDGGSSFGGFTSGGFTTDSGASEDGDTSAEAQGDGDGDDDGAGDGDGAPGDGDSGDGDSGDGDSGDGDSGDGDSGDGDGEPVPSCNDGLLNQDETDIDCGGLTCDPCNDGAACIGADDCMSGQCGDGQCYTGCINNAECAALDESCNAGVCVNNVCELAPANNNMACETDDLCLTNGSCNAGTCVQQPVNCAALNDQCNVGSCNPGNGACVATPINEGVACDDGDSCTAAACTAGQCIDEGGGVIFYEEFANNAAGWTLGTEWQITSAIAGCGDPGVDHTPTANNGVAGVVIGGGGCATTALHDYYCLTSPIINTAGEPSVWMTYYRDLYSDYTPYMKNKIEVYNGTSWVILFETFGSPGVNDASWTYFGYNVSAHANANMQFRWCHNVASGGAFSRGSWNVDDVTVARGECNSSD